LAYLSLLLYVAILFVRPQEWVPAIRGLHILDIVTGVALVTWLGSLSRSGWRFRSAPQNWLMLGLFFAALMSHVRHTYFAAFVLTFERFGKVVLLYFLVSTLVNSVRRARILILVMAGGCLFMSFHGILQYHTGAGFGGAIPWYTGDLVRVRAFGIFHDPNDLALILVTVLPFLFNVCIAREERSSLRAASGLAVVPMVYCIFLTNSRGGWLALAVMAVAYIFVHLRNKRLALVAVPAVLALIFALGPSRVENMSSDDRAARGRLTAWGFGNRMLKRWPLFGAGVGRFTEFSDEGRVAHNSFVQSWAEMGLFGYFFWLGLVMATLKDGYALARLPADDPQRRDMARLGRAGVAGLAGFLAAAFFLSRTYHQPLYIIIGLFAALRTIHERDLGPLPSGFVARDVRYVAAAELLSIPAVYVMIRVLM